VSKSRPVYAPFRLDVSGRAHLLVTDRPEPPEAADLALENIDVWTVQTIAPGVQAPESGKVRRYRAVAELLSHLEHRLGRERVGLRLYAIGGEAFLWDVHRLARAAGLGAGEIFLTRAGALTRRVLCIHCRTMLEEVAQTQVSCSGCGAMLSVRDHFSRRLGAFMGVRTDAEVPGEFSAPEYFA
jgi:dimethylamine monooxygenase subunit C